MNFPFDLTDRKDIILISLQIKVPEVTFYTLFLFQPVVFRVPDLNMNGELEKKN